MKHFACLHTAQQIKALYKLQNKNISKVLIRLVFPNYRSSLLQSLVSILFTFVSAKVMATNAYIRVNIIISFGVSEELFSTQWETV